MRAWSAFLPRWVVLVVGVFGWLLAVDAALGYIVAIYVLATGGPLNPYVSILFVVGLPLALGSGLALTGWAYFCLVDEARSAAEEVHGAAVIQGL